MRYLLFVRTILDNVLRALGILTGIVRSTRKFSPYVCLSLHIAAIVLITLLLAWYSPRLVRESRVWPSHWFVQRYYLAIQFVLLYLFVRLLVAGLRLLMARDLSEFADIDVAWYDGLDALARAGYDLQWLPVFVVCGATPEQEQSLFKAARLEWKLLGRDENSRASPLAFYACDEALFISLTDVGALPAQLQKRAGAPATPVMVSGPRSEPQMTLMAGQVQQPAIQHTRRPEPYNAPTRPPAAAAIGATAAAPPRGGMTMPPPSAFGATLRPEEHVAALAQRPEVLEKLSAEELRHHRRRLEHFCSRLGEERGTFCPMNGLLQVLPLRWTKSTAYEAFYGAAQHDLESLHAALHLQFPVICLHAGLEEVTGHAAFAERGKTLDKRFPLSNAGSRYPSGLPLDEKSGRWIVDRALRWFRDWVFAEFAADLANNENRRLYQFLCDLHDRRERFVNELKLVFSEARLPQMLRLSGWYFAATGAEGAFVDGVLRRLMGEQNDVAWSSEWKRRNSRLLTLTVLGAIAALFVLGADVYLVWHIAARLSSLAENS